jgi:radical SAM superfamily enzyme YgiQ (UPF0313 family)
MKDIVLTTINARYTHSSIALRYLHANLKILKQKSQIIEYDISDDPNKIAEQILSLNPKIVNFGVYIWNVIQTTQVINIIKKVSPGTFVVLGGPEVSYHPFRMNTDLADYIIQGEAEIEFFKLCDNLLKRKNPKQRIVKSKPIDLAKIDLPYKYYTDDDIKNRIIYVEASRGCPFHCEFCLSSIDKKVRYFKLESILEELDKLWARGARSFKFIDRTFNLDKINTYRILDFFLEKKPPYFVHFEVIPEFFPKQLKSRLEKFPDKSLQLEIGIQSLDQKVLSNIKRNHNIKKIKENLRFLHEKTSAHMHLDLIFGLPGQSVESFANDLNNLVAITDSKIQLGILKKLSGTSLKRHDKKFKMVYSDLPPYEIIKTKEIDYFKMQKLKRMARFWEIIYNRNNFDQTVKLLWENKTVFEGFFDFSEWLYAKIQCTFQISLNRLAELLFEYIISISKNYSKKKAVLAKIIINDMMQKKVRKIPGFLKDMAN